MYERLYIFSILLFTAYIIGCFVRPCKLNGKWMEHEFTTAVKGLSILTVVWAHMGACLGISGIQFIAGIGVALFLICSGYGLEKSYQKNGLSSFWSKRILKVCIPFWVVELLGMIVSGGFALDKYIKDSLFIEPATSYGWYMQYIVICYLIFFLSKVWNKVGKHPVDCQIWIMIAAFATWFLIESIWTSNPAMPFLKARQMMCFPCGVLIARYKERLTGTLNSRWTPIVACGGQL